MEKNDDKRQQLISEVLAPTAGTAPAELHAHAMSAWHRLAAHLSPLIGEAGFCALYGRAVRLAAPGAHWPATAFGLRSIATLLATLADNLATLDADAAQAANAALLDTFTKLLAGLIGAALTTRLMNTAWADAPDRKST